MKAIKEIYRLKTPIALLLIWIFTWGWRDSLMTISFLTGFLALAWILGHIASKELFGKYQWDVGRKMTAAWECAGAQSISRAILASGMLFARVMVYVAILIAMAIIVLMLKGAASLPEGEAFGATIYDRAKPMIPILKEEHQRLWPESDITIIAEQIHHESGWKPTAKRIEKSGVVSYGLLQVLDVTLGEMQKRHEILAGTKPVQLLQARWGIRAGILYDKDMWKLCDFPGNCLLCHGKDMNRWAFTLSAYNGGFGWIQRDRKMTAEKGYDGNIWFHNVELFSKRSRHFFTINRRYAREILANAYRWRRIVDA